MDTRTRLEKIQALAADPRGDPKVRAIAVRFLAGVKATPPTPPGNTHPGLKTSVEYDRYLFMDLGNWGKSQSGNYVNDVSWKNRKYTIVLFRHKQTPTYGWLRTGHGASKDFSGRYNTLGEAQRSAWESLTRL